LQWSVSVRPRRETVRAPPSEGERRACFVHSGSCMNLLISSRKSLTLLDAIMKRASRRHFLKLSEAWVFAVLGVYRHATPATIAVTLGWARQQAHRTLVQLRKSNMVGWVVRDEEGRKLWELTEEGQQRWLQLRHTLTQYEEKLTAHEVDLTTFSQLAERMVEVLLNRPQDGWAKGLAFLTERPLRVDIECCRCSQCSCDCHAVV